MPGSSSSEVLPSKSTKRSPSRGNLSVLSNSPNFFAKFRFLIHLPNFLHLIHSVILLRCNSQLTSVTTALQYTSTIILSQKLNIPSKKMLGKTSTSQPSCYFSLLPKSLNPLTSAKSNLFISPNAKSLRLLASSESSQNGVESKSSNLEQKNSNPISESVETEAKNKDSITNGKKEMPLPLRLAMEKTKEYKKKKGDVGIAGGTTDKIKKEGSGLKKTLSSSSNRGVEKVSSIDFVGLNFSDKKKTRGLPAGLVPMENNFSEDVLSEVEVILGDTSKFGTSPSPELNKQDESDLYKPKVSTWGVFPRPNDISKTFGGGRTIRPGDVLETAEDKAAKDARTKQLLVAYKNKMGLNIDAKLKSDCEKALRDGDNLMDKGKLKDALPFYEKVMKDLAFQNEIHGMAALQWSICQDSLSRQNEARVMYEKLQSHPNAPVRKKAQQFLFGFQAMEILKVKNSSASVDTTDYRNYFEAFVQDKTNYPLRVSDEEEEDAFRQILPYIIFLAFPIVFVLLIAARRGI